MEDDIKKKISKMTSILRQSYWDYLTIKTSKTNGFDTIEIGLVFLVDDKSIQNISKEEKVQLSLSIPVIDIADLWKYQSDSSSKRARETMEIKSVFNIYFKLKTAFVKFWVLIFGLNLKPNRVNNDIVEKLYNKDL